jgi:hypothetical protein
MVVFALRFLLRRIIGHLGVDVTVGTARGYFPQHIVPNATVDCNLAFALEQAVLFVGLLPW